jgi:hypothetical protein
MLFWCLKAEMHFASEFVSIVIAAKRPLDMRQSFVVVAPRERDAFDLHWSSSPALAFDHGILLASIG